MNNSDWRLVEDSDTEKTVSLEKLMNNSWK